MKVHFFTFLFFQKSNFLVFPTSSTPYACNFETGEHKFSKKIDIYLLCCELNKIPVHYIPRTEYLLLQELNICYCKSWTSVIATAGYLLLQELDICYCKSWISVIAQYWNIQTTLYIVCTCIQSCSVLYLFNRYIQWISTACRCRHFEHTQL